MRWSLQTNLTAPHAFPTSLQWLIWYRDSIYLSQMQCVKICVKAFSLISVNRKSRAWDFSRWTISHDDTCQCTCIQNLQSSYTLQPKYTSARPSIWKLSHAVRQWALCFCKITSQTWHGMTLVHTLVHGAIQGSHIFNQIKSSCWKWRWNWITALETSPWISCNEQVPLKERHTSERKYTHTFCLHNDAVRTHAANIPPAPQTHLSMGTIKSMKFEHAALTKKALLFLRKQKLGEKN